MTDTAEETTTKIPLDFNIVVETRHMIDLNGSVVSRYVIDYSVKQNRQWLGRHCTWALSNGYMVVTYKSDEAATFGLLRA